MTDKDRTPGYPDRFERQLGLLHGLPDVVETKPTTIRYIEPLLGTSQTFILQTVRQREVGDHLFLEYVDAEGSQRLVIPPKVVEVIARQREALTKSAQRKHGRRVAAERKARGESPGFLRRASGE
jgi:hypothetical protein